MKRRITQWMRSVFALIGLVLMIHLNANAQGGRGDFNVGGRFTDGKTNEALIGVTVMITDKMDSSNKKGVITDMDGSFRAKLAPGNYVLSATYIGYKTFVLNFESGSQFKFLGQLKMMEDVEQLSEVKVEARAVRVEQKGDTTQYNAAAYKTNPDASGEDLVRKMPGIVVEGGQVKAQGEEIRRVTIDGREFMGNDATMALRNLPADVIGSIQVYDRSSDQAQFTGFNDGDTEKAINIVTKMGADAASQFGKIYAGYGTDNRYAIGGNYNYFKGDRRVSVLGMANNINQMNFSSQDLLGVNAGGGGRGGMRGGGPGGWGGGNNDFLVGQQGGINTTNSLGLNFIDTWGKKKNFKITGSYFVSSSDNINETITERQFFTGEGFNQLYNENRNQFSNSVNHRFSGRMDYTIDSLNSVLITPRLNFQSRRNENFQMANNSLTDGTPISTSAVADTSNSNAINFSNDVLWRRKLNKTGRTLSANLGTRINNNEGLSSLYSLNEFFREVDETEGEIIDQLTNTASKSRNVSSNITYTEPLFDNKAQLAVSYKPSYTLSNSDRFTNRLNEINGEYDEPDTLLSNQFENRINTQRGGASLRMRGEKFTASAGLDYQYLNLSSVQEFPRALEVDKGFNNLLPTAMFMYNFSKTTNMRFFYRTNTQTPSVNQLQNVVDNSNPLFLTAGNENLEQQYNHLFVTRFGTSNPDKGSTFFAFLFGSFTNNYITNATFIARQDTVINGIALARGSQLSNPVNLEGYANFRSFVSYGVPVGFLKSNLNFNGGVSYLRNPGLINEQVNMANTVNLSSGLVLSSNISEKVDFTLSYNANYNLVENSVQPQLDNNYYFGNSMARFNWMPWNRIVFNIDYSHTQFVGLGDGFDQQFSLLNGGIGYKFLKNNLGELRLNAYDLLNQNVSISRNISETFVEDVQTRVLTRYLMLTFTYNIRKFAFGQTMPEVQERTWPGRRP